MDLQPRRAEDVVIDDLAEEAIAYKRGGFRFFRLSSSVKVVWRLCDGERALAEISRELSRETGLPEDPEWAALCLQRLYRYRLIETRPPDTPIPKTDEVRRRLLRMGLGLALLPVVTLVNAPSPADAGSLRGSGASCTDSAQCRSGVCFGGKCV